MSRHILIIDDDPIMQHIMSHLLIRRGYEVATAEDGAHACAVLESLRPDVICLDMMMPDTTGVELLRCIRQEMQMDDVPVILLSSTRRDDLIREAETLGISKWLSKPVTSETLSDVIEVILQRDG